MKTLLEVLQIFVIFMAAIILAICIGLVFFGVINGYTIFGAGLSMLLIIKFAEDE